MKLFINIKEVPLSIIRKQPFLFWVIFLCYLFIVLMLYNTNGNLNFCQYVIVGFSVLLTLTIILIYYFILIPKKIKRLKLWLGYNFLISKQNKQIFRLNLIRSNWGLLIGSIAYICVLFRVNGIICFILFSIQIYLSCVVFISFITNFNKQHLIKKWIQSYYFTITSLVFIFICDIGSRYSVTSLLLIRPEQLPSVTRGIYWFIYIICLCYVIQFITITMFDKLKREKIPKSPFIVSYLFIILGFGAIPSFLFINSSGILKTIVQLTYRSDMLTYFRCNDGEIIKNMPNQSARYLKVDQQQYYIIYFENNIINIKNLICKGQDYKITDI